MPPEYVDTLRFAALGELEAGQQVIRDLAGAFQVPQPGHQHQVLPPGEDLVHGRELPGEAEGLPHLRTLPGDVEAIHGGRPRVGLEQRGQDIHDRGLARAVGAEQGEDAAPRHVEVHAAQHAQLLVRLLKSLHADGLGLLGRHRDVPSFPVASPAARFMALVSRVRSRMIH